MEKTREEHEWLKELNEKIDQVSRQYDDFVRGSNTGKQRKSEGSARKSEDSRLSHGIKTIFNKLSRGFSDIIRQIMETKETEPLALDTEIFQHIHDMLIVATTIAAQQKEIVARVASGECLQDAIGITDESLEALYRAGKYFYDNQLYEEASHAFTMLSLINPLYSIFWASLGNCEYFLGRYKQALMAYALASQAEPNEPQYHIFAARCHKALGNKGAGLSSLQLAEIAPDSEDERLKVKNAVAELKRELEAL